MHSAILSFIVLSVAADLARVYIGLKHLYSVDSLNTHVQPCC